jgi:hypothetical protein
MTPSTAALDAEDDGGRWIATDGHPEEGAADEPEG